jgi:hypothetical protein
MDWFDFAVVEKTMKSLNWTWTWLDSTEPPSEPEIRQFARNLLKKVIDKKVSKGDFQYLTESGGFRASKFFDGVVKLEFIVSQWDVDA